jgi:hypothetical protein
MRGICRIELTHTTSNTQELEAPKLEFDQEKVQYAFVYHRRKEPKTFVEEQKHRLLSQGGEDPRQLDEDLQRLEMEDQQEEIDQEEGAELLIDQLKHCENDEKEVIRANFIEMIEEEDMPETLRNQIETECHLHQFCFATTHEECENDHQKSIAFEND